MLVEGAINGLKSEPVYLAQDTTVPTLMHMLKLNGKIVEFEIDNGRSVTIMYRSAAVQPSSLYAVCTKTKHIYQALASGREPIECDCTPRPMQVQATAVGD